MRALSEAGRSFLQCSFASPDKAVGPMLGIPDGRTTSTKVLIQDHGLLEPLEATSGQTRWYMVLPTPGVAYWFCDTIGTDFPTAVSSWTPKYYPGCFGTGGLFTDSASKRAENFNSFRYAANAFEITCTTNDMQWNGSITTWKTPVRQVVNQITKQASFDVFNTATPPVKTGTTVVSMNVADTNLSGLDGVFAVPVNARPFKFKDGCYMVATNKGNEFPFSPIMEGMNRLPTQNPGGTTASNMDGVLDGPYLGCGNMDALIIRVIQPTVSGAGVTNTGLIQTWACVEYIVSADSSFYQSARTGAKYDPLALAYYAHVAKQLPTAVRQQDNAGFWEWVLNVIKGTAKTLSYLPGSTGMIGAGVGMAIEGIEGLFL